MSNQQGQPPSWSPQSGQPPNWNPQNQGWGSPQQPPQQRQPQPNTPYPQQSYQPPPQYYQQQPYYQQPPMQPPKKKSRAWLWIVLGVAGVLLCSCIGFAAVSASQQKATSTITAPADTQSANNTAQSNAIGKPVVVNSDWTVTLNNVSTSQGTQLDQPKAGHILLVINVTLKNTSSAVQKASTLVQWALKDSTGQTYNQDILFGAGPDGTVGAGSVIRGNIAYEVPTSAHSFTLQFVPNIGSTDLAEWNVSI